MNLIAQYVIGGSSDNADNHRIGWGIAAHGGIYGSPLHDRIRGDVEQYPGITIELHNPYGHPVGKSMQFDQRIESWHLPWVRNGMPEFLTELTTITPELIVYLGKIKDDPDKKSAPLHWLNRSILGIPKAASIAFDAVYDVPEHESIVDDMINIVEAMGHRVYIEPIPWASDTHLHHRNTWDDEARRRPSKFATREQLTGQQVRFVLQNTMPDLQDRKDAAKRIIERGDRLCVATFDLPWAYELVGGDR